MREYMIKLQERLQQYGLRIVDLLFFFMLIIMFVCIILVEIDVTSTRTMIEKEMVELKKSMNVNLSCETSITGQQTTEVLQETEPIQVQTGSADLILESKPTGTEVVENTEIHAVLSNDQVELTLEKMTLEEKIYQLFIVTPEVLVDNVYDEVTLVDPIVSSALDEKPVGGVILFSQDLESPSQVTKLISEMQGCMEEIGMWIAVDEEGGKVARCAQKLGTTSYRSMSYYGNLGNADAVYKMGEDIADDISQFGFNLDFAPVADVNLNPNNELGDRIFSDDPQVVSEMVSAMVEGLQSSGKVSATLKHFPGLGAEGGNTHNDLETWIDRTYDQLDSEEFEAFRGGIEAGADFVMVGHQIVSCAGDNLPSDLSYTVITEWLRNDLEFNGVVVTDAHNMNTISGCYLPGTAAKMAIEAGADIVLMPVDLNEAFDGVYDAVLNGDISEERIDESVRRILNAKVKHGLIS